MRSSLASNPGGSTPFATRAPNGPRRGWPLRSGRDGAVIAAARLRDPRLEASVRVTLERNPSEVSPDNDVARAIGISAADALGTAPEVIGVPYWMDMALLNEAGIPTVAFGPSGHGEHADVEWVDCASLALCVNAYLNSAVHEEVAAGDEPARGSRCQ